MPGCWSGSVCGWRHVCHVVSFTQCGTVCCPVDVLITKCATVVPRSGVEMF